MIVAVGVNSDGRREILGMDIGPSEAETYWTAFLRKLARRGLCGVKQTAHYPGLNGFYREVRRIWLRCLRRRSQKSRRMGWSEFEMLPARFRLPVPRITRTWAQARI